MLKKFDKYYLAVGITWILFLVASVFVKVGSWTTAPLLFTWSDVFSIPLIAGIIPFALGFLSRK